MTRSTVIRLRITPSDGGAHYSVALYHSFIRCHASLWKGVLSPGEPLSLLLPLPSSTAGPPSNLCNPAAEAPDELLVPCRILAHGYYCVDKHLHGRQDPGVLLLVPRHWIWYFLCRAAKIPSSLVGMVGGQRGIHVHLLR